MLHNLVAGYGCTSLFGLTSGLGAWPRRLSVRLSVCVCLSRRTLPRGAGRCGHRPVSRKLVETYAVGGGTALRALLANATEASTFFWSVFLVMKSAGIDAPSMCTSLHSPSRIL